MMQTNIIEVDASEDQEEAAREFERYDLVEVAVVDDSKRLVGVLTIDDIVDVIHEEATEDMQLLAGVGDEELSDTVLTTVRSRATWLVVNLGTAILASVVIGLFDATIEQMVALAVLMPIVASMGGNAATQTMTVTVRALAMRELDSYKIRRLVLREMMVGVLNGMHLRSPHRRSHRPQILQSRSRSGDRRCHGDQHDRRRQRGNSHSPRAADSSRSIRPSRRRCSSQPSPMWSAFSASSASPHFGFASLEDCLETDLCQSQLLDLVVARLARAEALWNPVRGGARAAQR